MTGHIRTSRLPASRSSVTGTRTAMFLGPPAPVAFLAVGGVPVVEDGALLTADADELGRDVRAASRRLQTEGTRR